MAQRCKGEIGAGFDLCSQLTLPFNASPPVTLTWQGGAVGASATYSWTLPGIYTLTVTATNPCGEANDAFTVTVSQEIYRIYLPLVLREG